MAREDTVKRHNKARSDSRKESGSALDWVSDNATPILVGAASVGVTMVVWNMLTDDDDDDDMDDTTDSIVSMLCD